MPIVHPARLVGLSLAIAALSAGFAEAQVTPLASSFEIGPAGSATLAASNTRGDHVVAWDDGAAVYVRPFDASGDPRGPGVEISGEGYSFFTKAVGMDGVGNFAVAWQEVLSFGGVPPAPASLVQRFHRSGSPLGPSVFLGPAFRHSPVLAMDAAGRLVVAGQGIYQTQPGIYFQRFGPDGAALGGPALVAGQPQGAFRGAVRVAVAPSGEFAVAWGEFECSDGACRDFRIWARRYGASGQPRGDAVMVTDQGAGFTLTAEPGEGFLAVWSRPHPNEIPTGSVVPFSVHGRSLGPGGLGPEFAIKPEVSADLATSDPPPAAAVDALGNLLVVWRDGSPGFITYVAGQLLSPAREPVGERLFLPASVGEGTFLKPAISPPPPVFTGPAVAATGAGRYLASWASGFGSPVTGTVEGQRLGIADDGTCTPGPRRLCLLGRRFLVEGSFHGPGGQSPAGAVTLSDKSGYFTFFTPDNLELGVKMVDGSALNDHFWFFYGGLSNVGYELLVTDTVTGAQRTYGAPRGELGSQGDVFAFTAGPAGTAVAPGHVLPMATAAPVPVAWAQSGAEVPTLGGRGEAGCATAPPRLCLRGRFQVELEWTDFQGITRIARVTPLSLESGYFWFGDRASLQVAVKVLDGRALNDHFWVFYGSATNVGFVLRVTDVETGQERTYSNPPGRFASMADTAAF